MKEHFKQNTWYYLYTNGDELFFSDEAPVKESESALKWFYAKDKSFTLQQAAIFRPSKIEKLSPIEVKTYKCPHCDAILMEDCGSIYCSRCHDRWYEGRDY